MAQNNYTEDNIRTIEGVEHIRLRPGMYIGRLGDGRSPDDGIYVLLKEIIDNSIDEFSAGFGKEIRITIEDGTVSVRDFGRGIPLGKVVDAVSILNTGGKFDDKAFKKSVGLNGVGTKAVNALSSATSPATRLQPGVFWPPPRSPDCRFSAVLILSRRPLPSLRNSRSTRALEPRPSRQRTRLPESVLPSVPLSRVTLR